MPSGLTAAVSLGMMGEMVRGLGALTGNQCTATGHTQTVPVQTAFHLRHMDHGIAAKRIRDQYATLCHLYLLPVRASQWGIYHAGPPGHSRWQAVMAASMWAAGVPRPG